VTHHVQPSRWHRCGRPIAAGGETATASPSCAAGGSPPTSIWTRSALPRSQNEPALGAAIWLHFWCYGCHPHRPEWTHSTLLQPPHTRHDNQMGGGERGNCHSYRGSTQQCTRCIAGEFWLRRRGEIPLLSQIKICNNILDPEALVVLYGDNSLGREVRISFILRIAIDFGYRHWNRTHASTAQNAACIWRGKPGMSNRNAKGIAGPHERRVLW
jgi:hypothetical protein